MALLSVGKFRILFTVFVFSLLAFSACNSGKQNDSSETVKILSALTGGRDDAEMRLFEQALSKATGINVSIERPAADYNRLLLQKLQTGERFDLVYLGMDQYKEFVAQDALLDITDWVASSSIFQNNINPQEIADITIDGRVYAGFNKQELHRVVAMNNAMLLAAGIDYTKIEPTLDGYYEVFKALREANPDPDFYPFNLLISEAWNLQPWMAAAGLKNGAVLDGNGQVVASYAQDEAAPVWQWLKKLYDERLLDPGSLVDNAANLRAKMGAASAKTAVTADWAMWVGIHNNSALVAGISPSQYEIVSLPGVLTPQGTYMLVKGGPSLFAIPKNAPNPKGAFAILEFFATQEGGELLSVGIEGHDFVRVGDHIELTEIGKTHSNDHGAPSPIYKNFVHPIGYNPGVQAALEFLPYATVDYAIPGDEAFRMTQGKWYVRMLRGEVSIPDGLQGLRSELVSLGLVDR